MKYLDKFINYVFSVFILFLSGLTAVIAAGLVKYEFISDYISSNLFSSENRTLTCIISIIVFVLALKTTLFLTRQKKDNGLVMVDTNNGKLQIAKETIEGTAKTVAKKFDNVLDASARMEKTKKGVDLFMSLMVLPDTNIMEITSKVQDEVKTVIEGSTGVRVTNIDVKVKNVAENKIKNKTKNASTTTKAEETVKEVVKEETVEEEVKSEVENEPIENEIINETNDEVENNEEQTNENE